MPLDTTITPNQGGTYSSAAINRGSPQVRNAAAEARLALLQLASETARAPVDRLTVSRGVVSVAGNPQRSVTYGELLGDRPFNLEVSAAAPVKAARDYRLVGTSPRRNDMPDKVSGRYVYMQHVRVPGMLHGRVIRPAGQARIGVTPKVSERRRGVDPRHPGARPPSRRLRRRRRRAGVGRGSCRTRPESRPGRSPPALPGNARLHERMRSEPTQDRVVLERGNVAAALASATHVVTQVGRGPYQSHAAFGPNCAVADVRADSARDHLADAGHLRHADDAGAPARTARRKDPGPLSGRRQQLRARLPGRRDAGGGDPVAARRARRCACSSCARTSTAGTTTVRRTSARSAPRPTREGRIVAYEYHGWQHNWSNVEASAQLAGDGAGRPRRQGGTAGQSTESRVRCTTSANLKLVNHRVPAMGYLRGRVAAVAARSLVFVRVGAGDRPTRFPC